MLKKIIVFVFSFVILFTYSLTAFSESFSVYGSVTSNTSQVSLLIESMHNQPDYNPFRDWVAFRTGDLDYSLFYNIKDDGTCVRLRYYGTLSGYNTVWHLSRSDISSFSYYSGDYTIAGNTFSSLGSSSDRSFQHDFIFKLTVPFILVLFIFFIFRIRKRGKSGVMEL